MWDTSTGTAILNSLTWSKDGSMLAFIADPQGSGQPGLYIYSMGTGTVQEVSLPQAGAVSHPVWSPDGLRVAFELTHNGTISILDYNTQNHGMLTIASTVNTRANSNDSVLTLDWSSSVDVPAITWSVGTIGHIHSLWVQHVGMENQLAPRALMTGDYVQATYSKTVHDSTGSWLLVTAQAGLPGDVIRIDLNSAIERLTRGKQVSSAQWSPDGLYIDYFDTFSSGVGTLHVVNVLTGNDTLIATGVINDPAPVWSPDSQSLVYSTGMHVLIANLAAPKTSQQLKLQGPASAFSWSPTSPNRLVVAMSDGQQGIYLVDTQHDTTSALDKKELRGPIMWTQIP
jgi:Tol biopolymer transport system component